MPNYPSHRALRVLVVEDEPILRLDIANRLIERGCDVIEARSGEHALAVCKTGRSVDVVVTDIQLGGPASGFDVADAFRAADAGIGVIYTSGNTHDQTRSVPGSVFLSKPCRTDDILTACRTLRSIN